MLKLLFCILCLVPAGSRASAQTAKSKKSRSDTGIVHTAPGNIATFGLTMNLATKTTPGLTAGFGRYLQNDKGVLLRLRVNAAAAQNIPADYALGLVLSGDGKPNDILFIGALNFIRRQPVNNSSGHNRFLLELGPSLGVYHEAVFYRRTSNQLFSPNYEVTRRNRFLVGLDLMAGLDLAATRHYGLRLGVWANVNNRQPLVGFDLSLVLGKMY